MAEPKTEKDLMGMLRRGELLTMKEVAAMMGRKSYRVLRILCHDRRIEHYRLLTGRPARYYMTREQVAALIVKQAVANL